ncbi:MAG: SpoIVB peptidase S55 domain-containing protein [Candidatus Acidiferrales bacterium]
MPSAPRTVRLAFLAAFLLLLAPLLRAGDAPAIFPLDQVQPGMKGEVYTIFQGDTIEKVDLEVIGVMHNALGPKQDIIIVRLLGDEVAKTGVVAGMSGSPVYIDGKLAGALSLKLGSFTREAIGGVTPIENMYDAQKSSPPPQTDRTKSADSSASSRARMVPAFAARVPFPETFAQQVSAGAGQFLVPIETPLIASGIYPGTIAEFSKQLSVWGMSMVAGGTSAASPEDAKLQPGDMVGIELIRGDLSLTPGCTVTTVQDGRILACGHPIFGFGDVSMPIARAHVLMTLASALASTKIITTGGTIGTLTGDHVTAIAGHLGPGPAMIPVDVTFTSSTGETKFHFEVIENRQLTPTLVALAIYNGIAGNTTYGEGNTLDLKGAIELKGHTPVALDDLYSPIDLPVPSAFLLATSVERDFSAIYANPYEPAKVTGVNVAVTSLADRRSATIDGAWVEKREVHPGETVAVKVLLRPYRGDAFVKEIPITIPEQTARGNLELVISDAATLNRNIESMTITSEGQLPGLEELVKLLNRQRRNDRLYATLLQQAPTLLVEDKEMPNAPLSAISVFDQRDSPGGSRLTWQSSVGEWSAAMDQVISGERTLSITVK